MRTKYCIFVSEIVFIENAAVFEKAAKMLIIVHVLQKLQYTVSGMTTTRIQ